jgi:hypothetical protein
MLWRTRGAVELFMRTLSVLNLNWLGYLTVPRLQGMIIINHLYTRSLILLNKLVRPVVCFIVLRAHHYRSCSAAETSSLCQFVAQATLGPVQLLCKVGAHITA